MLTMLAFPTFAGPRQPRSSVLEQWRLAIDHPHSINKDALVRKEQDACGK
jgi:hypothetical protein